MSEIVDQQQFETHQAADDLRKGIKSVLGHAVQAYREELKVYQSLQNLNEVIGTEYGNRVIYELIQNAHDAHTSDERGRICVRLSLENMSQGTLYIANEGRGFSRQDIEAIKNLATSSKGIGEGIGNKGLGFRSIEALTQSVRIYSRSDTNGKEMFEGYCFRFADIDEIAQNIRALGVDDATSDEVAKTLPRYLVPVPLEVQPDDVRAFARDGFSSVIVAPLENEAAVTLAKTQVKELTNRDVPLMLFLDRITEISIEILSPDNKSEKCTMQRQQKALGIIPDSPHITLYEVNVGKRKRFLVAKSNVDKVRVHQAVTSSVSQAPQLKRWLNWKGTPVVSVAVGLNKSTVTSGRLYNFLPMSAEATSPIYGYIDAPFFADIDRRNADMNLPLNRLLMEVAAETCATAALSIVTRELTIGVHAVFDLFAWAGNHRRMMQTALERKETSLGKVRLIPVITAQGKQQWSSLQEVFIWPEGKFAILKPKDIARYSRAHLVSGELNTLRIARLREVAKFSYMLHSLDPSPQALAKWAEAFADSLVERKSPPAIWTKFYDDLVTLFAAAKVRLSTLEKCQILYDRQGKLRPAGGHNGNEHNGVFVRRRVPHGDKKKEKRNIGIPLPPTVISRRYRFLDEKIVLSAATFNAFISADLIREYDPIKALSGLKNVLSDKATAKQRQDALLWAFEVWRCSSVIVDEELKKADLYVPVQSGWFAASKAMFSSSWTPTGKVVESYLTGAAASSADCNQSSGFILIAQQDWPGGVQNAKTEWIKFLHTIGVYDGLQPIESKIKARADGYVWNNFLRNGDEREGFDSDWCTEVMRAQISFYHPQTAYTPEGKIWRLPGQLEHLLLPVDLREQLCTLIFAFLKTQNAEFFTFKIGRFERPSSQTDSQTLPTPLGVFLRTKTWLSSTSSLSEGVCFSRPDACWASRERRNKPPRFMDHLLEHSVDMVEESQLAERLFSAKIGLRDWNNSGTALDRMSKLVNIVTQLNAGDRTDLQREYQRSWREILVRDEALPEGLDLIAFRRGQYEVLRGKSDLPPAVIVTSAAQKIEAQMLASAGYAILSIGLEDTDKLITRLGDTRRFQPRKIDDGGVQLRLDGESFYPNASDPLLISFDMKWLPEILIIGLALLAENLERGVHSSTVEKQLRAIRVRRCKTLSFAVQGDDATPTEMFVSYAWPHETLPTLIIEEGLAFNWNTLAKISRNLSRLVDARLRFIETLLLRLAVGRDDGSFTKPDEATLALEMNCDVQTIRDHYARLRTDITHVITMLLPVVTYFKGIELAQNLKREYELSRAVFDARNWIATHLSDIEFSTEKVLEVCETATDRVELRKMLSLNFQRFNLALKVLGETPLSYEDTLRRLFTAYVGQRRSYIIDRLRRYYLATFDTCGDLSQYIQQKSLDFIAFNPGWILTHETLDKEIVDSQIDSRLVSELGPDNGEELSALNTLLDANRKKVREFAVQAQPLISVWCRQNGDQVHSYWQQNEPQMFCRQLENKGILDFRPLVPDLLPDYCLRAGLWPSTMPLSLDKDVLNIDMSWVSQEKERVEQAKRQQELERRSIFFAGKSLDTASPLFADQFRELASADGSWQGRSQRKMQSLMDFGAGTMRQTSGGVGGKRTGHVYREPRMTPAQQKAMGLASEWLAFQYLRERFPDYTDETCWVSGNRASFLGGDEGDDSAGYDFMVKTPKVEWFFEVKSTLEDGQEFELTANELRLASSIAKDASRRYRILYVPHVFSPDKWSVVELPNPMGDRTRNYFSVVGQGSLRLRFQRQDR
ncbi:sacsin N-terminal ATP-binding-like domain-containing protein [Erwinia persicina]|uniref:sacsin N-terminal ATP-binding-like domain-containing protein n=1 Tax=Erwinia persicina TaxID=55211 RepID=UPI0039AF8AB1